MRWRVIMQPEAKLELKHEAETYGERLVDEVDAVREWLRKMPLRLPAVAHRSGLPARRGQRLPVHCLLPHR